jgi:HD-like signal output (HDOD) protein
MVPDPADLKQSDRKGVLASIPAFPPIVLRLLDLLAREDVEIRDLVALISADPAFCAQVLKVANSPVYGCRYQVDSLQSALFVLGLYRVRCLCTTLATANQLKALLHVEELARCWRHMLACALLTSELAHCCSAFEDRAYTAGLLHDIGRLGLLLAYPKEYAALLRAAALMPSSDSTPKSGRSAWTIARPGACWPLTGVCRLTFSSSPDITMIHKAPRN